MAPEIDPQPFGTRVTRRQWLSPNTFEIRLERPLTFSFAPGQFIRFEVAAADGSISERDYSLITAPTDPDRYVPCLSAAGAEACPWAFQGRVTAYLADRLAVGE